MTLEYDLVIGLVIKYVHIIAIKRFYLPSVLFIFYRYLEMSRIKGDLMDTGGRALLSIRTSKFIYHGHS